MWIKRLESDVGIKMNQCLLGHELWTFLCVYTVQEEKRRGRGRSRFVQKLREFVGCDPIANAICVKGQKSLDTGSHTYIHTYAYTKIRQNTREYSADGQAGV